MLTAARPLEDGICRGIFRPDFVSGEARPVDLRRRGSARLVERVCGAEFDQAIFRPRGAKVRRDILGILRRRRIPSQI